MAKPRAFIETTIISYLTAYPSKDSAVARDQQKTHDWWATASDQFELITSPLVISEAVAGNVEMARRRLEVLATITTLDVTRAALDLADGLVRSGALPEKARNDATHVAAAVTSRAVYLVTWNCKHLANEALEKKIDECCRKAGYTPVLIRTPAQLIGAAS
jgi:hypothetical protein